MGVFCWHRLYIIFCAAHVGVFCTVDLLCAILFALAHVVYGLWHILGVPQAQAPADPYRCSQCVLTYQPGSMIQMQFGGRNAGGKQEWRAFVYHIGNRMLAKWSLFSSAVSEIPLFVHWPLHHIYYRSLVSHLKNPSGILYGWRILCRTQCYTTFQKGPTGMLTCSLVLPNQKGIFLPPNYSIRI